MRFFSELWNLYLGLLSLLGHALLVLLGLALCGYSTLQQMDPLHDTVKDVLLFGGGMLLVAFSTIRRMIWSFCGVALVWGGLMWGFLRVVTDAHRGIDLTPELIAIAAIPPFFATLYLETLHKRTSDLEISLSEKPDPDS